MRIVLDLQGAQSESRFRGIGRYSLALAQAIARERAQHEVWLALSGRYPDSIEPLRTAFADLVPPERIRVFELPGPVAELDPANTWRMQAAELLREKFLKDLDPDIVHVSTLFEGLGNEVVASIGRLDATVPTAATLYDLIPLLCSDSYLAEPARKRHYLRHAQSLKRADLLLAISESSSREAIQTLDIPPSRIVNIGAGLNPCFWPAQASPDEKAALMARSGFWRPLILYAGGLEPRKNLERLIAAFALLPKKLRMSHQLGVVGELLEEDRRGIASLSRKQGLEPDDVVCIGYASDEDLRSLYGICALFVLPSLHEGFGLPALEAMGCGAPVIGSNCTSIPEIIDRKDALFDPMEPRDIAERIAEVLSNAELRRSLKEWGPERAKAFTWESSAHKALQAFEALHAEYKGASTAAVGARTNHRPLLALVAPLPPERTGVAGYSARLLPNLARHYEIVCIVDQAEVTDPLIAAEFPIRDVRWFEANAASFDRILYQFGNSPSHKHMFALLERHPGVVVLHDFYLSSALNWMSESRYAPGSYVRALYESHGFFALEKDRLDGRAASVATFPCNAAVLQGSVGVIVHSNHAIELARTWYGDQAVAHIWQVPFLPFGPEAAQRREARKRLALPENAFVLCSFGWVAPVKLSDRLLEAWLASPLAQNEACYLAFVGQNDGTDYGRRLLDRIAGSAAASRIRITDYCEESLYRDYFAAADLAVQLRNGSRGETSATVFDCLSRSLPVLINAHGSAAELPDDAVIKLDDDFTNEALSAALARLRTDTALRQKLASRGVFHVSQVHNPERVARLYNDIIEQFYTTSPQAREQKLVHAVARIPAAANPTKVDLAAVAAALTANRERPGRPQILVDVTNVARSDLRTGIERATRGILMALIADPPPGYRIEPVCGVSGGYLYARQFTSQCLASPEGDLTDDPVETGRGDIFIGLDWCADVIPQMKPWFLAQRRRGMQVFFAAYDLLPVLRPEFFPPHMTPITLDWISAVAEIADGVVCISRTVADELNKWLAEANPKRLQPLSVGFFHLGGDLHASLPTTGQSEDGLEILTKLRARPSILMVGTMEPRKGHRQTLAAMERLWAEGVDVNLVIVGKQGWNTQDLAERVDQHPEHDTRLFWLQGISDEMLEHVYRSCRALLAASEAEGFGLPLIEAARYGLPIIARDIPVFREVAGEQAYYFAGEDPQALADALRAWLSFDDAAKASTRIPCLTWQQSSRQLLDVVLGGRWYCSWPDPRSEAGRNDSHDKRQDGVRIAHSR
jgi:glycosyltransferase involved in cell wall biosynthesis